MLKRLKSIPLYFIYWLIFFQTGRLLFFIFTSSFALGFSWQVLANSMLHAMWLDMSVAGYFSLILTLILIFGFFSHQNLSVFFTRLHSILLVVCSLAVISNAVIYTYWSGPLDGNALKYLKTPTEAAASINWWLMIIPIITGILLFLAFRVLFKKLKLHVITPRSKSITSSYGEIISLFLIAGFCIIPIRGGLGIVPVNLSFVFFHKDIYPNHAAYNPVWNVIYSLSETSKENNYHFMDDEKATGIFNALNVSNGIGDSSIIETVDASRPNIVFIVLESYLSKLVNYRYKGEEVCPYFNELAANGIYFKNLYASGDRSDKGLVSLFSGYPALPKSVLVQYPDKFTKVPSIYKDLAKYKYSSAFYYGGNLDFANLKSYFLSAGVKNIMTGDQMSKTHLRGKWGVHDEAMFEQFGKDLKQFKSPYFASLFTLSNHEPYDLPGDFYFGKSNLDEEYLSAARYTDNCLKKFITALKQSAEWEKTLIVLVADHGVTRLGIKKVFDAEKYHIPMVWTGGVVKKPLLINTILSQTDVPLILLNQLKINPIKKYMFSNPLNRGAQQDFATYYYNDGLGMVTKNCVLVYDNISHEYQDKFCKNDSIGTLGKAYLQVLSQNFTK